MNRFVKKAMAILLAVAVSSQTVNLSALAQENDGTVMTEQSVSGGDIGLTNETNGWDGVTTQDVYEGDGYRVTFTLTGHWEGGYNANVRIENTGVSVIENWYLDCDYLGAISNIWNAELVSVENGKVRVKNAGWNQDINSGSVIEFGFSGKTCFTGFPSQYELVGTFEDVAEEDYSIIYSLNSDWGSGFTSTVVITNNSDKVLEDWYIEFLFDRNILNIWDGVVESHDGNKYVIKNCGYNSNIPVGGTISFGFAGDSGKKEDILQDIILFSSVENSTDDAKREVEIFIDTEQYEYQESLDCYNLTEEAHVFAGTLTEADYIKRLWYEVKDLNGNLIETADIPIVESWSVPDMGFTIGANTVEVKAIKKDDELVQTSITLFNYRLDNLSKELDMKDIDGDGIPNYIERFFGMNKESNDTDEDGLTDYQELLQLMTDPAKKDSDDNGIEDGFEDSDEDGLTVLEELKYATNPFASDTDGDGLIDGDEVNLYGTEPTLEDTDGDGLSDYEEILLRYNPLETDTNQDGIFDIDEVTIQTCSVMTDKEDNSVISSVDVTMPCAGYINHFVSITDTSASDRLSAEVVGLIGFPIDITSEVEFDYAQITFHYDEKLLGETQETDLCMMWYDAENDVYVLLEDSVVDVENNTVSYKTTHFSTYLVVDKTQWINTVKNNAQKYKNNIGQLGRNQVYPVMGTIYKCFEVGMTWDEAKKYCEDLGGHLVTITSDGEQKIVESLMANQGTKNSYWIGAERDNRNVFSQWVTGEPISYTHYKDGRTDNAMGIENALMIYRNNNPMIYGYCFGYWNDLCKDGTCKNESFFGLKNMGFICEWNDVDLRDSDGDGALDIYEDGYILSNGRVIRSNPGEKDTDGDGISDYDEMGGEPEVITIKADDHEYQVLRWRALSDPNTKDSDQDGVFDYMDANPMVQAPNADLFMITTMGLSDDIPEILQFKQNQESERAKRYGMGIFTEDELDELRKLYNKTYILGFLTAFSVEPASTALRHYLDNTGTDLNIDKYIREAVTANRTGRDIFNNQIDSLYDYAENVLKDGETMTFINRAPFRSNTDPLFLSIDEPATAKWYATLGTSSGYVIANISRQGAVYSMNYRYIIYDYYDWITKNVGLEFIPGFQDFELGKLESCGWAKSYFLKGEMYELSYDIHY